MDSFFDPLSETCPMSTYPGGACFADEDDLKIVPELTTAAGSITHQALAQVRRTFP